MRPHVPIHTHTLSLARSLASRARSLPLSLALWQSPSVTRSLSLCRSLECIAMHSYVLRLMACETWAAKEKMIQSLPYVIP
jgi:hypothetical protein